MKGYFLKMFLEKSSIWSGDCWKGQKIATTNDFKKNFEDQKVCANGKKLQYNIFEDQI